MFHPIEIPFDSKVLFNEKFSQLAEYCDSILEVGYDMLWQGVPD